MSKRGKKIARIKDIAELAEVSPGTVDRVIHNRGKVSDEAREKVLKSMKALNYEPNVLARALVTTGKFKIAALIPDPANDEYWEAPNKGVDEAEAQMRRYGVIVDKYLFNQNDSDSFKEEAAKISELNYHGILVAPIFYRESLAFLNRWSKIGIPFNLFNTHIPDYKPVSYVGQDSYQSGVLAGKLLHYGCSEGTFVVVHIDKEISNSTHLIRKEQGFIDYFSEKDPDRKVNIVRAEISNWGDKNVYEKILDDLFEKNQDIRGFFVTNSRSFIVGDYLIQRNMNSMKLVGYDLLSRNLELLEAGIIDFLINQNPQGQGFWGVTLLVDYLVFKKEVESIKYLPLDVVTRENAQYYI
ncbi:LacI family DNA-binding transcriptional regulator [Thermophagus sp. OGC60D27]|uniref:LacI family DNA-binding transcriptional regulator n=1 Tax=Thermophagus sp. OGC60D27 TaxID=3458415 RepID=UPI0040384E39